jgi:hypothetical protein
MDAKTNLAEVIPFLPAPKRPIGEEIDELFQERERIRKLGKELDARKEKHEAHKEAVMKRLEEEGLEGSRGKLASVGIDKAIVPTVEDWDEFYRFIHRNKSYHLLERRPAANAYRELLEQRKGKPVPGVVPFEKRTLSLRTV